MKQFACGAMVRAFHAVLSAEDEQQLTAQVAEHARAHHGSEELSPELIGAMHHNIMDTAA